MAAAMLLPALADLRAGNRDWLIFIQSATGIFMAASLVLVATRGAHGQFTARSGFLLTACLWFTACFLGSLPLYFSHLPLSFAQAVFESVSGITTTGATVLSGLDTMPRGILLWRSLLTWIGGVGFIALALLLLPSLRVGGVKLFYMESSNTSEKVLPRVHQIANAIVMAYLVLTLLCILCYFAAGMTLFDAVNNAMSTVATAGFSTHDSSFGYYTAGGKPFILTISSVFMILSSLPFIFYISAALPAGRRRIADPQVKVFLLIVAAGVLFLALWLHFTKGIGFAPAFNTAFFHLASVISTTGFTAEDYTLWGGAALAIFFAVSFIGGCAGSTAGGIKVNRIIVLWQVTGAKLTAMFSPHRIIKLRYGEAEISAETAQNVLFFVCLYLVSIIIGTCLILAFGLDFTSAFTGALTTISNIGPGFGNFIGPVNNFSRVPNDALWVLSFLMLIGRLEIITVFVLFVPAFWRR